MRQFVTLVLTSFTAAALLSGCTSREVAKVDPKPEKQDGPRVPVEINRNVDILFVIDNSLSMEEEQASLSVNFPRFIDVLERIEGGLPNVHIGVVSTDVGADPDVGGCERVNGDNGELQSTPRPPEGGSCEGPTDKFISDIQDPNDATQRIRNYDATTSTLEETFSCIAALGTEGCGFEQPLEAMYRALLDSSNVNQGFLRADAFLAIIFLGDEDDCSTRDSSMFLQETATLNDPLGPRNSFRCFEFGIECEPDDPRVPGPRQNCKPRADSQFMYDVDRYVKFLQNELGKDPANIIVAAISGDPDPVEVEITQREQGPVATLIPSCLVVPPNSEPTTEAAPAIRLKAFIDQFPQRNTFTTICNDDLSVALELIANLLAKIIGNPCMPGDIDTDPDTAGIQEECIVSDVRFPDTVFQEETLVRKCTGNPPGSGEDLPCWHLQPDAACTAPNFPSGLSLVVERGNAEVASGTTVIGSCVVQ